MSSEVLQKFWWLLLITIPGIALILWAINKKAQGELGRLPVRLGDNRLKSAAKIVLFITIFNFGIWGAANSVIHGDAINGKIEDGKYYVAMKGKYTEVSKRIFIYSYVHTWSVILSFPLTIFLMAIAFGKAIPRKRI